MNSTTPTIIFISLIMLLAITTLVLQKNDKEVSNTVLVIIGCFGLLSLVFSIPLSIATGILFAPKGEDVIGISLISFLGYVYFGFAGMFLHDFAISPKKVEY